MGLPNPSRETKFSGANGDREISNFPCSADHEQDRQPNPIDLSLAVCDNHTHNSSIINTTVVSSPSGWCFPTL